MYILNIYTYLPICARGVGRYCISSMLDLHGASGLGSRAWELQRFRRFATGRVWVRRFRVDEIAAFTSLRHFAETPLNAATSRKIR